MSEPSMVQRNEGLATDHEEPDDSTGDISDDELPSAAVFDGSVESLEETLGLAAALCGQAKVVACACTMLAAMENRKLTMLKGWYIQQTSASASALAPAPSG